MIAQLPQFPTLTKIRPEHRPLIENMIAKLDPYSDFSFSSLYCWCAEVSSLNNNLVIKIPDYNTGRPTFSVLGRTRITQTLRTLLHETQSLSFVPKPVVSTLQKTGYFDITDDQANFDYVYELQGLASLSGLKYKKKRNKLNKVLRDIGDRLSVSHEPVGDADQQALLAVYDRWALETGETIRSARRERNALERLLMLAPDRTIVTTVAFDNAVVGFSINEVLADGYAICHFEKALMLHPNLYILLVTQAAQRLIEEGAILVNWEQDLGDEGIRSSKLSYHPAKMLKKYTVGISSKARPKRPLSTRPKKQLSAII